MKGDMARLWAVLSRERRRQAMIAIAAIIIAAGAEFVTLLSLRNFLVQIFGQFKGEIPVYAASIFAICAIGVTIARVVAFKIQNSFALGAVKDISIAIFERAVNQPYRDHVNRNSGELFEAFSSMPRLLSGIFMPMTQALSGAVIAIAILICLFTLSPWVTLPVVAFVAGCYWTIAKVTRSRLAKGSRTIQAASLERMKLVNEAQRGFRELILGQYQNDVVREFATLEESFTARQIEARFAAFAPRYFVELAILLILTAFVCYWIAIRGNIGQVLPLLGILAMAFQRLMPLLNNIYYGWSEFHAQEALLANILTMLKRPTTQVDNLSLPDVHFTKAITMRDIGLSYGRGKPVLAGLDLTVERGTRIGIMGASGAGKSSLLDIMLGLIEPSEGQLLVDGQAIDSPELRAAWQKRLSCVSQDVYLRDDSIRNIIANPADIEPFNPERYARAITQAQLDEFIAKLPQGDDTRVGEGGGLLSGGQKQRMAIARALYAEAEFLVLDEATSQLDSATEMEIVSTIEAMDRSVTVIIVAHRESSLTSCDRIYKLDEAQLKEMPRP